jgi:hypothetical protein
LTNIDHLHDKLFDIQIIKNLVFALDDARKSVPVHESNDLACMVARHYDVFTR